MAKKYYWLKLKQDFFQQKSIKRLRKIAGGDTYTIIYLKLQLLSLENEGKLYFEGYEENFIEELALDLDEEVDNVKITLTYLEKHNLLEHIEENEIILPETIKSIGSETEVAQRVRDHRKRKELLQSNENLLQCNTDETICNTEIEKEKDLEKKKDIYLYLEKERGEHNDSNKYQKEKDQKEKDQHNDSNKHKKTYGEYENVFLTDEEHEKLKNEYGIYFDELLKNLDEGKELYGYSYKNDYIAFRQWAEKDEWYQKEKECDFYREYDEYKMFDDGYRMID